MDLVFNVCAVPFGYVSALAESDEMSVGAEDCSAEFARQMSNNEDHPAGSHPLPDIILSSGLCQPFHPTSAPTASPLRRAVSCPFFLSDNWKTEVTVTSGTRESGPRDHHISSTSSGNPKNVTHSSQRSLGSIGNRDGLEHIQEVRFGYGRKIRCSEVPFPQSSSRTRNQEGGVPRTEDETRRDEILIQCGNSLRMMADQFQIEHAKIPAKDSNAPYKMTVPVALAKCLSASLLIVVWWRIINKFR